MPIIGFSIRTISAERKKAIEERLDINSSPKIINVEEKDIEIVDKQQTLSVGFEFETSYSPDVAKIKLVGEVLYAAKNVKEILKVWKKDGKLPDVADMEIKNFLLKKCLTLGISLADELQLPPPLVFPAIVPRSADQTKYIG